MSNKESYRAKSWGCNLNLIVYVSIVFSALGMGWLALNGVPSGTRYILIFLIAVALLFLSFFFINENQKQTFKVLLKNPFTVDIHVASGLYLLGWCIPILLQILFAIIGQGLNVSQVMIPLTAENILTDIEAQSFAIAEAESNPFWNWFIVVFTAGSIEEFAFGFVLVLVLYISGMLFWKLVVNDKTTDTPMARNFYLFFALIGSALIFGGMHQLNNTYIGYMFFIAILFRFIMNYGIYVLGFFLSLTLGYHQSNNAVWFFLQDGGRATFNALSSFGGILIILYFALIILFVFRNFDEVTRKTLNVFKGSDR